MTKAPTVAVIGCGPGGMFLLHAIETHRKIMQETNDQEGLARLPIATCFERASEPGGVWRAERKFASHEEEKKESFKPGECSNMYEALWTNGAKELIEFFDYTFLEHFGGPAPVYLPRRVVLDYILARVTRKAPTILKDHVCFNTDVTHVTFDDSTQKFVVETKHIVTGEVNRGEYDKCVWAAGDNGKTWMPESIVNALKDFQGTVIHSSDARDLEAHVRGKRILLIGGGASAEDLALMSIKLGVEKVFVSFRTEHREISDTAWWPMNKVKVYSETIPVGVSEEGRNIELVKVKETMENVYQPTKKTKILKNVDTVIFCTGYDRNYHMLEEKLRPPEDFSEEEYKEVLRAPPDWKMSRNLLTDDLGDVPVQQQPLFYDLNRILYIHPGVYRGVLISNPSIMYMYGEESEAPLQELDAHAWRALAYMMGTTKLPSSPQEMRRRNNEIILRQLDIPFTRYEMDKNYREALDALYDQQDHWIDDEQDPRTVHLGEDEFHFTLLYNGLTQHDGHYPVQVGSLQDGTLSEYGKKCLDIYNKEDLIKQLDVQDDDDHNWRTFRDLTESQAQEIESPFTGTKAIPLKKRWLDIDEAADEKMW